MNAAIKGISDHFTKAADLARCTETANAMLTNGRSLVLNPAAAWPAPVVVQSDLAEFAAIIGDDDPEGATDSQMIDNHIKRFGGTRAQAVARLLAFVGDEVAA